MFIAESEKKDNTLTPANSEQRQTSRETRSDAPAKVTPSVHAGGDPPLPRSGFDEDAESAVRDIRRRMEDTSLQTSPVSGRRVHSNAFARMSGETSEFRPVVSSPIPPLEEDPEVLIAEQVATKEQKAFNILSWGFVLSCVSAASLAIVRIKKLTARA